MLVHVLGRCGHTCMALCIHILTKCDNDGPHEFTDVLTNRLRGTCNPHIALHIHVCTMCNNHIEFTLPGMQ
jgi:hypothetical protein